MTDADAGAFPVMRGVSGDIPDLQLEQYSQEFDALTIERHRRGAEKYGPGKFLYVDTMQEALFELADLSNYARYTFIKVRALQDRIAQEGEPAFKKMRD